MKETKKERKKERKKPLYILLYLPMNEKSGERIVC